MFQLTWLLTFIYFTKLYFTRAADVPIAITERCFVALKPDAVQRNLIGECVGRLERKGLKIAAMKMVLPSEEKVLLHYAEHRTKPYFQDLYDFFVSGPIVCLVCEGVDAIQLTRIVVGKTHPAEALPGTIRGDFCAGKGRNLVHASDSAQSAEREISIWFDPSEILAYDKDIDRWVKQPKLL